MRVKFYFDVGSLQSWILFEQLIAVERCFNIRTEFTPVRASLLYTLTGARNPYYVLPIRQYVFNEVDRLRELYGVPFHVPQDAERKLSTPGTVPAQHFLTRLQTEHPNRLKEASRFLWRRLWVQQGEVHRDEDFETILRELALPPNSISAVPDVQTETKLKSAESEVVQHGGYAVPFVVVHKKDESVKKFIGMDSWPLIAKQLELPAAQSTFYGLRSFNHLFDRTDALPV
ncbi:Glutathione S-transferase kappa 1 isoform X1 [Aphelenchoides besseyi]|nr:Glutathione S-transferase kappa 1 isoform X1 [Aphelenchoides besseyi]KAI6194064.1 Glutathione S-transferase kappa 1 isoform X1 [Aphelenchoides besseyi]